MNAQTNKDEKTTTTTIEIELNVEELEEVIAPTVRGRVDQPDPPNRPQREASSKRRLALVQFSLNEHGEATFTRS